MQPVRIDAHSHLGQNRITMPGALVLLLITPSLIAQVPLRPVLEPPELRINEESHEAWLDSRHEPVRAEASQAEQRRERPIGRAGGRAVYRDSLTPHWFADNTKFWYRNDLPGGSREFILVDANRGTRHHAFDHMAVARQLGGGTDATRLPVHSLRISDDDQSVVLVGRDTSWTLDLQSGELEETTSSAPDLSDGLLPRSQSRPNYSGDSWTDGRQSAIERPPLRFRFLRRL